MDYLHLANAMVTAYASAFSLYVAARSRKSNDLLFALTVILCLGLTVHALYHYASFLGSTTMATVAEFASALLLFFLLAYYTLARRGPDDD